MPHKKTPEVPLKRAPAALVETPSHVRNGLVRAAAVDTSADRDGDWTELCDLRNLLTHLGGESEPNRTVLMQKSGDDLADSLIEAAIEETIEEMHVRHQLGAGLSLTHFLYEMVPLLQDLLPEGLCIDLHGSPDRTLRVDADRASMTRLILSLCLHTLEVSPSAERLVLSLASLDLVEADCTLPEDLAPGRYASLRAEAQPAPQERQKQPFEEDELPPGLGRLIGADVLQRIGGGQRVSTEPARGAGFEVLVPLIETG